MYFQYYQFNLDILGQIQFFFMVILLGLVYVYNRSKKNKNKKTFGAQSFQKKLVEIEIQNYLY